jgi:ABC-type phosphate/phosphonate transport system substrate-binding protein
VACILNLFGHEEYAVKAEEVTIAKKGEYNLAAYVRCSRKSDDKVFGLLSDYLSTVTGYKIEYVKSKSEDDFLRKLKDTDFAIQHSFAFWVLNHKKVDHNHTPVAITTNFDENKPEDRGTIVVRSNSNIRTMDDLRGKTFLFGAKHNTPKFFSPYMTFIDAGIDIEKDLKRYEFGGSCKDNSRRIFKGEFDACVTGAWFVISGKKQPYFNDLKLLFDTKRVPQHLFTVSNEIDHKIVEKVKKALLEWKIKNQFICGFTELSGNELTGIGENVKKYGVPIF